MNPQFDSIISLRLPDGTTFGLEPQSFIRELLDQEDLIAKSGVDLRAVTKSLLESFKPKEIVPVERFTNTLAEILSKYGIEITAKFSHVAKSETALPQPANSNINLACAELAKNSAEMGELGLSTAIINEVRRRIKELSQDAPIKVRINGLRPAIKQALCRERWSPNCSKFSDYLIEQLRVAVKIESNGRPASLIIREET